MLCFLVSFQSTHPLRGATQRLDARADLIQISIHAPLAGCDVSDLFSFRVRIISIHAPLAGCDRDMEKFIKRQRNFNPRTPCGVRPHQTLQGDRDSNFNPRTPCGVRPGNGGQGMSFSKFQSTHPLRGATSLYPSFLRILRNFNPRTPCGVRLSSTGNRNPVERISIHAPLAGCDLCEGQCGGDYFGFQSTHPLRGATHSMRLAYPQSGFQSTHPLRGATSSYRQKGDPQ